MRDIAIIGGGASGIYAALLIADRNPNLKITIFEKEQKLGKKLCATGNGHCNLLNRDYSPANFNHTLLVENAMSRFSFDDLLNVFSSWGIPLIDRDGLFYPANYHAPSFVNYLSALLEKRAVEVRLGVSVKDYSRSDDGFLLKTNEGEFSFRKIIIATGGKSTPKLGSDGSMFDVLRRHGYEISELQSGLAPIRVKEKLPKALDGERHAAKVRAFVNDICYYEEAGEILFKKDGLSGIVMFNVNSFILRNGFGEETKIRLDLFPGEDVSAYLRGDKEQCLLTEALYEEVAAQAKKNGVPMDIAVHELEYTFKASYGFENSQVTIGGLIDSEVSMNLESKREPHVFFTGECLNVDGFCGGFNLTWALLSALLVAEQITR